MTATERSARSQHDELARLHRCLQAARSSGTYGAVWDDAEPLVTVPIATWNRAETLVDTAVESVLRQSYQRFEIVIVGDHCTDDTEARLQELDDPRIRFHNLARRSEYPADPRHRWMVSGAQPWNLAVEMGKGTWIAPLDDDDAFSDDHIEVLLGRALEGRFEMVYGRLERYWADSGERDEVGAYPPALGHIGMQAMIYLADLDFIECDPDSWVLDEPTDWNFIRRMRDAGVRIGFVDQVVGMLQTTHKAGHLDPGG